MCFCICMSLVISLFLLFSSPLPFSCSLPSTPRLPPWLTHVHARAPVARTYAGGNPQFSHLKVLPWLPVWFFFSAFLYNHLPLQDKLISVDLLGAHLGQVSLSQSLSPSHCLDLLWILYKQWLILRRKNTNRLTGRVQTLQDKSCLFLSSTISAAVTKRIIINQGPKNSSHLG